MIGTYNRLRVSVHASNREVIAKARKKIAKRHRHCPSKREDRKAFYRAMLEQHRKARELYHYVLYAY